MRTFAYLTNPVNNKQLKKIWPFFKPGSAFKTCKINSVRSIQGTETSGYMINVPLLPEEIINLDEAAIIEKINEACSIALKHGCQILGLGGLFAGKKFEPYRKFRLPVTGGTFFAVWSIIELVYRTARVKKIDLKNSPITIICASDLSGNLCAKKLSFYTNKLILTGSEKKDLELLREAILRLNSAEVIIEEDLRKATQEAGIVIIASGTKSALVNFTDLKANAIVCDIDGAESFLMQQLPRKDITVINAGLIKAPFPVEFPVDLGLPKDIIPAALAETILLTLEGKFIGRRVNDDNIEKLEEIANIAVRHGFEVWAPEAPSL